MTIGAKGLPTVGTSRKTPAQQAFFFHVVIASCELLVLRNPPVRSHREFFCHNRWHWNGNLFILRDVPPDRCFASWCSANVCRPGIAVLPIVGAVFEYSTDHLLLPRGSLFHPFVV